MSRFRTWPTLTAIGIATAWIGVRTFIVFPRGWIQDDAYFYAQIAFNLGTRGHSSFDGIHVTSGYHLLWGWLLGVVSFLASLVTLDKGTHLVAMVGAYIALVLVAADVFGRTRTEKSVLALSFLFLTVLMETALLAVLLLAVARMYRDEDHQSAWQLLPFFLMPLVRIDATIIGVVAALAFCRERRRCLWMGVAVGLGACAQLALTRLLFGEFFSVVAEIKADDPWQPVARAVANVSGESVGRLLSVLVLYLLTLATIIRSGDRERRRGWMLIGSSVMIFLALHVAFNNTLRAWYFLPCYALFPFVVFSAARSTTPIARLYLAAHLVLLAGYVSAKTLEVYRNHRDGVYVSSMRFARGIADHVPPDGRIFVIDGSGFLGYFSERTVVNGDGLVNTYAYARARAAHALGGYLREHDIRYFATNGRVRGEYLVDYYGLRVRREDAREILASTTRAAFADFQLFVLSPAAR